MFDNPCYFEPTFLNLGNQDPWKDGMPYIYHTEDVRGPYAVTHLA